ncbi:MAG: hypothetical protein U0L92_00735 [Clostridia bacterium]|nr:hypothetical protein [Clostridia bacterium]
MHQDQEHAWHTFEQTGSIASYLQYRSLADKNRLSATVSTTENTQRKESTHGHCGDRGHHYP